MSNRWIVHKFGGSSLAGSREFSRVADIVSDGDERRRAVVVSAPAGVTDRLLELLEPDTPIEGRIERLRADLDVLLGELLDGDDRSAALDALDRDLDTIRAVLASTRLLRSVPPEARSLVSGFGETWSARLLARVLARRGTPATWLDARDFLIVG
ncbi:MAG: bifunctional aspartate kinase/homoserine dehydrogenase I, partial [Gemmatimonadetes bacterium]|nr:bifunctional aspartate kinase/homoserine dehydrogenase I [Gemmatimonadota bacterium]